jgi:hypothetical protein
MNPPDHANPYHPGELSAARIVAGEVGPKFDQPTAEQKPHTIATLEAKLKACSEALDSCIGERDKAKAELADAKRHLTNIFQDQCESAFVEVSVADSYRQALAEVAPDHPTLKGVPPTFGVWEKLSRENGELRAENERMSKRLTLEGGMIDGDAIDLINGRVSILRAENEKLKAEVQLMEHRVITCGVAATHSDASLTLKYPAEWQSKQADQVRALRARLEQAEWNAKQYLRALELERETHKEWKARADAAEAQAKRLQAERDAWPNDLRTCGELSGDECNDRFTATRAKLVEEQLRNAQLVEALEDIANSCSLEGFPEDAPSTLAWIGKTANTALTAHEQSAALTAQPAGDDYPMPHPHLAGSPKPGATPYEFFPSYLIDHHEGDSITEESLQLWLSQMLASEWYAKAKGKPAATEQGAEVPQWAMEAADDYLRVAMEEYVSGHEIWIPEQKRLAKIITNAQPRSTEGAEKGGAS